MHAEQLQLVFDQSFDSHPNPIFQKFTQYSIFPLTNKIKFNQKADNEAEIFFSQLMHNGWSSQYTISLIQDVIQPIDQDNESWSIVKDLIINKIRVNYLYFKITDTQIIENHWYVFYNGLALWADIVYNYLASEKRYVISFEETKIYIKDVNNIINKQYKLISPNRLISSNRVRVYPRLFIFDTGKLLKNNFARTVAYAKYNDLFQQNLKPNYTFLSPPQHYLIFSNSPRSFLHPELNLVDLNIKQLVDNIPCLNIEDFNRNHRREILNKIIKDQKEIITDIKFLISLCLSVYCKDEVLINFNDNLYMPSTVIQSILQLCELLESFYSMRKIKRIIIDCLERTGNYSTTMLINDTARILDYLQNTAYNDKVDFGELKKLSTISTIHDWASRTYTQLQTIPLNIDAPVYKMLRTAQLKVPNTSYTVVVPEDTGVIRNWGLEQKHCIASYAKNAIEIDNPVLILGIWNENKKTWLGHLLATNVSIAQKKDIDIYQNVSQFYGKRNSAIDARIKKIVCDHISNELNYARKAKAVNHNSNQL